MKTFPILTLLLRPTTRLRKQKQIPNNRLRRRNPKPDRNKNLEAKMRKNHPRQLQTGEATWAAAFSGRFSSDYTDDANARIIHEML